MKNPNFDAIQKAVMRHSLAEVIHAILQGNDVDVRDQEGRTALFYAVKDGDREIAAELIRHGADVDAQDKTLKTPLHFAANGYQIETARLLLENAASVDVHDIHGNTPLSDAVFDSKGRGEMIRLLIAFGANKSLENKHGVSPESLARSIGNYDVSGFFTV